MKATVKYKCTVNNNYENGVWEVVQDTDTTLKINRISSKPYMTSYGMSEDTYTIKKDNYANLKINKDGTRTVSKHCFKSFGDNFILYPFRAGIPFLFEKIHR